jgi:hypothetical protein
MDGEMDSHRIRVPRCAITALALYALLVQAFLAGFAPARALPDLAGLGTILCSHAAGEGSSRDLPARDEHGCCLAACFAANAATPAPGLSLAVAWSSREPMILAWRWTAALPGAALAFSPSRARGPPVV